MLILNRKPGQEIVIGKDIRVMVTSVQGDRVWLGIDAPKETTILRTELLDRPPDGMFAMRCGAWVEQSEMLRHARTCHRCIADEAADRADMAHSDGDTLPRIALEAAAEDAYLRRKKGGREGPDPLDASQDPRCRE